VLHLAAVAIRAVDSAALCSARRDECQQATELTEDPPQRCSSGYPQHTTLQAVSIDHDHLTRRVASGTRMTPGSPPGQALPFFMAPAFPQVMS